MSRFPVDPRWLIYLPPTMSPVATSKVDELLEHPEHAFEEYAGWGVSVSCRPGGPQRSVRCTCRT